MPVEEAGLTLVQTGSQQFLIYGKFILNIKYCLSRKNVQWLEIAYKHDVTIVA